jgi:aldehyde:ferredoxin oxidoreductase
MYYTSSRYAVKNMDLKVFWRISTLVQRYGMDALCVTGITAWLMDLYEHGIITAADTDGIPMEWGSEAAMRAVVEKTAKREGFGKMLADGIVPAARRIGKNSIKYAVQSRNMNVHPGFSPVDASAGINMVPVASEVWSHPPGGDFYACYPLYTTEIGIPDEDAQALAADWLSDFAERTTGDPDSWREENYEKFADYTVVNETAISACDIAGHCDWYSDRTPQFGMWWGPKEIARAISAVTGNDTTEEMVVNAHRRRRLLELTYWKLCERSFGEKDEIPIKFLKPRPDGRFKGHIFNIAKIPVTVNRYFELMGIDPEAQLPRRAELERLGLKDVADMLDGLHSKERPAPPG